MYSAKEEQIEQEENAMAQKPKDLVIGQLIKDFFFTPNRYHLDDRFVIRDGKRHPVAIICPGGGYFAVCSFIEGVPIAKKLNELGISALIVYYRTKKEAVFPAPQDDLAQAVKEILSKKDQYMLDTTNYSIWGFSAGGHLAGSFGTDTMGYPKYNLPKPSAIILGYPVISMRKELTHQGSHDAHLGAEAALETEIKMSIDEQVSENYPPTYIWCGDADKTVPPENTKRMAEALSKMNVDCKCEIFTGVDHGVGPGTNTAAEGWIDHAVDFWMAQKN